MMQIIVKDAVASMRKEFSKLTSEQLNLGIARAINWVAAKGKTKASRDIREVYKIRAKDLNKGLTVKKASRQTLTGFIIAEGHPLPLIAFTARQVKTGVSINIMGTRKIVKRAFITTLKSGHRGVFARGQYQNPKFIFAKPRLPITELTTVSIPRSFMSDKVLKAFEDYVKQDFPDRLRHELQRIADTMTDQK